VAFSGATDFIPEMNRWLQIVEMDLPFRVRLTAVMLTDFAGSWLVEVICKRLFADLEPKPLVTRGRERREARRGEEVRRLAEEKVIQEAKEEEEKQSAAADGPSKLESRKRR